MKPPLSTDDNDLPDRSARRETKPRRVFPSPYTLTREQEDDLVTYALQRLKDLEKETGRDECLGDGWFLEIESADVVNRRCKSWMGSRQLYELSYEGEVDWRRTHMGGIYSESNWTVPISRRVVSQQVARANANFFGSDPWFSVEANTPAEHDLMKSVDHWVKHKFREAGVRHKNERAVEKAFVRGEAVIKRTYKRTDDIFEAELSIMCTPDGEPILDSRGEEIIEGTRKFTVKGGGVMGKLGLASDVKVLLDDPSTTIPSGSAYRTMIRPRRNTIYEGIDIGMVYYKDFLAPLNSPTLEDADTICHLYDIPVAELADQWRKHEAGLSAEQRNIDTRNAVAALREMEGNRDQYSDGEVDIAASSHRAERPEDYVAMNRAGTVTPTGRALSKVAEFWMRYDANGDGIMENILLVVDRETRLPIYYNYVGNITPDGRRPFSVIRINPVEGRWYGVGSMQIYRQIQNIVDLQTNRWNVSSSSAGRIDFTDPTATIEGEDDEDTVINWGGNYTLQPGKKAEDVVSFVVMPEVKAVDLKNMIDFQLQMALNMSGVQQPNDAQMAGLQSAMTATGSKIIHSSGEEMFGQIISHLEEGIVESTEGAVELCIVNMDDEEHYQFFDGENTAVGALAKSDIADIRLRIRLKVDKYAAEQDKANLVTVIRESKDFYMLPPWVQKYLAPLYVRLLDRFGVKNPESVIVVGGDPALALPMASGEPGAPVQAHHGLPGQTTGSTEEFTPQMEGGIQGGLTSASQPSA